MADGMMINELALAQAHHNPRQAAARVPAKYQLPKVPERVAPKATQLAMDEQWSQDYNYLNAEFAYDDNVEGFLGYALLSQLMQRPEYRMAVENISGEMLRKAFKLVSEGSDKKADERIKLMNEALDSFKVFALLRKVVEHDGGFGRGHTFIDTGADDKTLGLPLIYDKKTIPKGSLRGFKTVEPIWTYPLAYNSNDPLAKNFFVPEQWYVMKRPVHRSRFLTFVSREVPDILKPAYSFGGLSLIQQMRDTVNNWLRTRDNVSEAIESFSQTYLKTDMSAILQGQAGEELFKRLDMMAATRRNKGIAVCDMGREEFQQLNMPLAGLSDLQAQSQEQMCSITHSPVIKLLGLTPKGLNTSTEGEVSSWDDWIALSQSKLDPIVKIVLQVIQLHLFGEFDPAITHQWVPLRQLDDEALARVRKANADADLIYVDMGAVSNEEVRKKLAADPNSGYDGLAPDEMPPPPEETEPGEGDPPDDDKKQ